MGMDVHGKAPTSPEGKYFHATVWGWHPLADMLHEMYPDLIGKIRYLHSNDGDGLGAEDAAELGRRMQRDADQIRARCAACAADRDAMPEEPCQFCDATGTRTDAVGQAHGFAARGWCNACDGKGTRVPLAAAYRIGFDHAMQFAAFAIASGGFEIC